MLQFCRVIRLLLCLFLMLSGLSLHAQTLAEFDTIPAKPKARAVSNIVFQFDNRNERYYDVRARMNGLRIGMEYYKRLRTGFGFYGNNNFYEMRYPMRSDTLSQSARFSYSTVFAEVVVFRNFRWEVSSSGALGAGAIRLNSFSTSTAQPIFLGQDTIGGVGLYDIGLHTHYKIFPWFGLGVGGGYRNVTAKSRPLLEEPFTDTYIDFKIKVFIGYIYKGIFKPEAIKAERAYYDYRRAKRKAYLKKLITNEPGPSEGED